MNRILVTGATGFIGRQLICHLLSTGREVTALVRQGESEALSDQDVRILRGDVTLPQSLAGKFGHCDLVIHLAGCTIARRSRDFDQVNRAGTLAVAQACAAEQTPPTLLFVSSLAAAGPSRSENPLRETDHPVPVSDYGRSKLAAEQELLGLADRLPIKIVRPPSVFGDTDRYMRGLFKTAKAGWVFLPGPTEPRYSLIHVDDLVAALMHVAVESGVCASETRSLVSANHESGCDRGIIHLAQDPPMTFAEIATVIHDAFGGKGIRSVHVPATLCWGFAAINSLAAGLAGAKPLLNWDKMREAMAGGWSCDSDRLTNDLRFQFHVPLSERIRQTAFGYHERGWI
jgi:nucleoside-diphosphate-sugar epimerase